MTRSSFLPVALLSTAIAFGAAAPRASGGLFSSDERAKRAHAMPLKIMRDYEKSNLAPLAGWTYLQFTPEQLDKGLA